MKKNIEAIKENLPAKVVKSTLWLGLFQALDNVLGFIRVLVLARLLTPNDFGLVGIAWLILQIINTFTQTGVHQVLIHKNDIEEYLDVAWSYLVFRGIIIYTILFFLSPLLGSFFNMSSATPIIRAVGLTLLFEGFINIGVIRFQKDLSFHKQFIFQISGNFVDFLIAIGLAIYLHNVWAIIWGMVGNSITRLILSYVLSEFRPKFHFNFNLLKEMNNFGKWIFGSNILQFIYSQGDDILVGKVLGATSLGYYQLAYRISNLPATQITYLVSTVMFPAYSKIKNSIEKVSKVYISSLQLIAFLSFFVGTIIILFAYPFTLLFIGKQWLPMVVSMQILTIWGVIRSIGATTGPVWQALGTPQYTTKIQMIQVILLIIIIFPLMYMYKLNGVSLAVVISALVPNLIAIYYINKTLKHNIFLFLKEILFPFIASIVVVIFYLILKTEFFTGINFISFVFMAIICGLIYFITIYILQKIFGYTIFKNIFIVIKSLPNFYKISKYIYKLEYFLS